MSHSCAAELIKAELQKEGLDPALYGIHSLQAGCATTAEALGVPERLFQRQGSWHSDKARNNYIEKALDSLLLVTRTCSEPCCP